MSGPPSVIWNTLIAPVSRDVEREKSAAVTSGRRRRRRRHPLRHQPDPNDLTVGTSDNCTEV
jgi:hypothetical protein